MSDNGFVTPSTGQADWDASLTADLGVIERGYHITERAGVAINTGEVLWINSGGFAFQYNPNSESIVPHAMAFTAAASGDSLKMLAWGVVRSLAINSAGIPGQQLYGSAATPGLICGSYGGANRPIGFGLVGYGVAFRPGALVPETLTSCLAIAAVTGSLHLFTVDRGKAGYNRQTYISGLSADLVELKFYSDAARSTLLYSTKSGGVNALSVFLDRALWPFDNTDAVNSSAIYGSLKVMSAAAVGSDTIQVRGIWDRIR